MKKKSSNMERYLQDDFLNTASLEELRTALDETTVEIDGKRFVKARIREALGRKEAELANRQPGDPGTMENPIIKNGYAYVYTKTNRLALISGYEKNAELDSSDEETTIAMILYKDDEPSEEQIEMIYAAANKAQEEDPACPLLSDEMLERLRQFGRQRNLSRQKA